MIRWAVEGLVLEVQVDWPHVRTQPEQFLCGAQHHVGVVEATVLVPHHLHIQRLANLPEGGGSRRPALLLQIALRGLPQVHVPPENRRHRQPEGFAVGRQDELQVGGPVRNRTTRPVVGPSVGKHIPESLECILQGARVPPCTLR